MILSNVRHNSVVERQSHGNLGRYGGGIKDVSMAVMMWRMGGYG